VKRMIACAVVGLAVCMLFQAAASADGAGGSGQERPYFMRGDWRFVVNIDPSSPEFGQVEEYGTGVASLRGRAIVEGGGYLDMTGVYHGSGVATDASGAETWWWIEDVISPTAVVHIDGGTGRFADAIGELTNFQMTDQVVEVQWPYQITTLRLTAQGWLRF
jgi:hypothetical protein